MKLRIRFGCLSSIPSGSLWDVLLRVGLSRLFHPLNKKLNWNGFKPSLWMSLS